MNDTNMNAAMPPRVSVVLPILNEAADIDAALARLVSQSFDDFEVILADGGSTDGTLEILGRWTASDPRIRVISNPRKLQSAGLNEALGECRGEYLVRLDGHSFVEPDYLERCVLLLDETGAGVVGGRMIAEPVESTIGRGIGLANQSAWGAGPARFHSGAESGPAETVYLGAFQTAVVRSLGGWAEDVGVNEDYELNHRIAKAGHIVWLDVGLGAGYRPRESFKKLAIQYFRYGRSKAAVMRRHPDSVRVRQVLPSGVVPAGLSLLVAPVRPLSLLALGAHTSAVVVGAARADETIAVRVAGGCAALIMHWCWSAGFWFGLARPFPRAAATDTQIKPVDAAIPR